MNETESTRNYYLPADASTATLLADVLLSTMLADADTSALLAIGLSSAMIADAPTEERSVQGCGRKQRIGRDTYEPLCTMQSDFRLWQQHFGSLPPARGCAAVAVVTSEELLLLEPLRERVVCE